MFPIVKFNKSLIVGKRYFSFSLVSRMQWLLDGFEIRVGSTRSALTYCVAIFVELVGVFPSHYLYTCFEASATCIFIRSSCPI